MPQRVLVVTGQAETELALNELFAETGIQLFRMASATDAWQVFNRIKPNAVLIDINLSSGSAYDLADTIKHDPRFSATPVIFLTTAGKPFDEKRTYSVGVSTTFEVPFRDRPTVLSSFLRYLHDTRSESAETLSPATEQLLHLLAHRMRAVLFREIFRSPTPVSSDVMNVFESFSLNGILEYAY